MTFPRWMTGLGKIYKQQGHFLFTEVPASKFDDTMKFLRSHSVRVVSAISSHDSGKELEVIYHFVHAGVVLNIKFRVSRTKPELPTVVPIFPSAQIFEQENHEALGINFVGNQNLKPILFASTTPHCPLKRTQ